MIVPSPPYPYPHKVKWTVNDAATPTPPLQGQMDSCLQLSYVQVITFIPLYCYMCFDVVLVSILGGLIKIKN